MKKPSTKLSVRFMKGKAPAKSADKGLPPPVEPKARMVGVGVKGARADGEGNLRKMDIKKGMRYSP